MTNATKKSQYMDDLSTPEDLNQILGEMSHVIDSLDYYAITFTADEAGNIQFDIQTHWIGWGDEKFLTEVRAPTLVHTKQMIEIWKTLGQSYLVVNEPKHFIIYSLLGGHALIAKEVAQEFIPDLLQPQVSARSGRAGFVHVSGLQKQVWNRVPTPKQRMRIFKRDNFKCSVCGRRPIDYEDVELHIHHIRPWARGGLTEDKNLITLCHTCHKGLEPHEDLSLYNFISPNELSLENVKREYILGVTQYRKLLWENLQRPRSPKKKKSRSSR